MAQEGRVAQEARGATEAERAGVAAREAAMVAAEMGPETAATQAAVAVGSGQLGL